MFLSIYLSVYLSMSRRHPPSATALSKRSTRVQMFSLTFFSIVHCSVRSQARMYEINYIDQQFFIITKPQDKNSLNWPVGNGHSRLGLTANILFYHF